MSASCVDYRPISLLYVYSTAVKSFDFGVVEYPAGVGWLVGGWHLRTGM